MNPFARIRSRLAGWNLLVMSLLVLATMGSAIMNEFQSHNEAIERELRLVATRVSIQFHHPPHPPDQKARDSENELEISALASDLVVYFAKPGQPVLHAWGRPAGYVSPDETGIAQALRGVESTSDVVVQGEPLRLLSIPVRDEGVAVGAVQVGKPIASDRRALFSAVWTLIATGVAGLLLSVAGSFFLAGRAMGPMQALFEQERRFITDAAHGLRAPIAAMSARATHITRHIPSSEAETHEELTLLRNDVAELSQLATDLLDLARLDAGHEVFAIAPVSLSTLGENLIEQRKPLAKELGIELSFASMPLWANADVSHTKRVLQELLDNALKFTGEGGFVRLAVTHEGHWARIRVMDNGEGISPEHLPHVIDRFYRVEQIRSRDAKRPPGAGLGLSIAARLVRGMGGDIRIESELHRGTTVTVLLPLAEEDPSA